MKGRPIQLEICNPGVLYFISFNSRGHVNQENIIFYGWRSQLIVGYLNFFKCHTVGMTSAGLHYLQYHSNHFENTNKLISGLVIGISNNYIGKLSNDRGQKLVYYSNNFDIIS